MPYTVNKKNSSASPSSYTVSDGVVNTQTDLSFIGKGYAGYGETIAENFLHLLENFANTTAPTKPIVGQLYYDSTNNRLKVYNGSAFIPAGGNLPYESAAPSTLVQGDVWVDSDTKQLYFYDGLENVLVGPPSSTGTSQGFTYASILDSTDATRNVSKWYNHGTLVAIVSDEIEFTPKTSITGFATVKKGITLTTADTDTKFQGTATDSDKLGGVTAANYLLSNANDTTTGTLGIVTDSGMTVGADNDFSVTIDSDGAIIANTVFNKDITFKVNDEGTTTTVMTIDGSESRVGIGTTTPTTKLDVSGTVNATAFTGPLTGAVTGNVTGNVTGTVTGSSSLNLLLTGGTLSGTLTSQIILPSAGSTYNLGAVATTFANAYIDTVASTTVTTDGISITDNNISGRRSNEDLNISPSGTGHLILGALRVNGTTISSDDSSAIKINETLNVNNIASDDSSQVTVNDGLTVTGAVVMMRSLPTSDPSNAGQLWNSSGDLKISAG